jgi:threonine dehydratase
VSATEAASETLVGIDRIREAAATLRGVAVRTPLVGFGPAADRRFLKAESLQPIGAFKIRGAYVAMAALGDDERARGVITYSSGNHAQGVARAARLLGVPAVIVMPSDAPRIKRDRVAADGAEIVVVGTASEERREVAERIAADRGLAVIPPFDDDRVIAGQGTVGLEIAEDLPDVGAVLVPVGGGGLASGVAAALRALVPDARVIGVEPELAADARDSLAAGRIIAWPAADVSRTIADGTRTQALGRRTFAHLSRLLDSIVTVSEAEIAAGVRLAAEESRLVVEPSGALSIAALAFRADELGIDRNGRPAAAVVSGGNVDPADYRALLEAPIPGRDGASSPPRRDGASSPPRRNGA